MVVGKLAAAGQGKFLSHRNNRKEQETNRSCGCRIKVKQHSSSFSPRADRLAGSLPRGGPEVVDAVLQPQQDSDSTGYG